MSCGCKADNDIKKPLLNDEIDNTTKKSISGKIVNNVLRLLTFALSLIMIPVIIGIIIYYMFKTIVLSEQLEIKPFLTFLANTIKKIDAEKDKEDDEYDDDDDDEDYFDENNYIMLDVDDITEKKDK